MPCRCDEWEPSPQQQERRIDDLEQEVCRARSLVHKLAKIIEGTPSLRLAEDLAVAVARERRALLVHKRAESRAERMKFEQEALALERRMKRIKELGGQVPSTMVDQYNSLLEQASAEAPTDDALLG